MNLYQVKNQGITMHVGRRMDKAFVLAPTLDKALKKYKDLLPGDGHFYDRRDEIKIKIIASDKRHVEVDVRLIK